MHVLFLEKIQSLTEEEEDEDGYEDIEVVDELVLEPLEEPGLEELVPRLGGDEGDEEDHDEGDLGVEEAGDQGPVETHLGAVGFVELGRI